MDEMKKRELRKLFEVNDVQSGSYGEGFYDALNHVHKHFVHAYRPKQKRSD